MIIEIKTGDIFQKGNKYLAIGETKSSNVHAYAFSTLGKPTKIPKVEGGTRTAHFGGLLAFINREGYTFVDCLKTYDKPKKPKEPTLFNIDDL